MVISRLDVWLFPTLCSFAHNILERSSIMASERFKSARQDGHNGSTRSVGMRTKESRFDDDGDEVESETDGVLWDRYLGTEIGSRAARSALDSLMVRK